MLGVGAIGLMVVIFTWSVPWISQAQESPLIGRAAGRMNRGSGQIATYRYFAPNLPFYAKQRVERLKEPEEVSALLAGSEEVVLCLKAEDYAELTDALRDNLVVQQKVDRFLRDEQILILTRKPSTTVDTGGTRLAADPEEILPK
jgi:hypothetical protein